MPHKLPDIVQRFEREGKIILINPDVPAWVVTDPIGEQIVRLFDGTNSLSDVISLSCEALGTDAEPQVRKFCSMVLVSPIFERPDPRGEKRKYPLGLVHLSLSDKCNLQCRYCYAAERVENGGQRLGIEEYRRLIDEILLIGPDASFTLTGGEPLLNPLWKDIAAHIKSHGNECLMLTNGILISQKNIGDIKKHIDRLTLSIDGSNAATHALTRGDNFDAVMRSIELLEGNGVEYSLSMTVCKNNISDVPAAAKRFGSKLSFAPFFPMPGAENDKFRISGMEYFTALKNAAGVNPLSYCESSLEGAKTSRCHKCAMGDGEISISATGDVYPCQLLHVPELFAGSIREKSISEIYSTSPVLDHCSRLDVDQIEDCRDCAIKYICGGACRARAYYECGSIEKSGDFCQYELEAYLDGILRLYDINAL